MHTAQRHTTNSTRQKTESKHSLEKILCGVDVIIYILATIFLASYSYDLYNLPSHVFQLCLIIIAIHSIFALMECCAIKDLYKIGIITALFGKLLYVLASLCFMVLAIVYWTSTTRIGISIGFSSLLFLYHGVRSWNLCQIYCRLEEEKIARFVTMSGQINEAFETTDENFSAQQYNNETLGLPSYAFLYQNDMENLSNYDSLRHS